MSGTESSTKKCITCGDDLHPERAIKYDYCMKPECQAKNLKGLDMVAVGVNKSAEQYMLLDEATKADLARGKYHDQRRGTFGQPESAPGQPGPRPAAPAQAGARPGRMLPRPAPPRPGPPAAARPIPAAPPRAPAAGHRVAARLLAVLYNQQGLRPDEIARKLGLSRYDVTQIILAAKSPRRS